MFFAGQAFNKEKENSNKSRTQKSSNCCHPGGFPNFNTCVSAKWAKLPDLTSTLFFAPSGFVFFVLFAVFFFHLFIFGEYVLEVHKYIWRERSVALSQSFACDSSWHISLCCFDKKWAISLQGTFVKQPVYCVLELLHSKVAKELVSFWITQRPCTLDRGRGLNHAG